MFLSKAFRHFRVVDFWTSFELKVRGPWGTLRIVEVFRQSITSCACLDGQG